MPLRCIKNIHKKCDYFVINHELNIDNHGFFYLQRKHATTCVLLSQLVEPVSLMIVAVLCCGSCFPDGPHMFCV